MCSSCSRTPYANLIESAECMFNALRTKPVDCSTHTTCWSSTSKLKVNLNRIRRNIRKRCVNKALVIDVITRHYGLSKQENFSFEFKLNWVGWPNGTASISIFCKIYFVHAPMRRMRFRWPHNDLWWIGAQFFIQIRNSVCAIPIPEAQTMTIRNCVSSWRATSELISVVRIRRFWEI